MSAQPIRLILQTVGAELEPSRSPGSEPGRRVAGGRGAARWQGQGRTHVSKPSSAKAAACFASPAEPPLKKHAMEAFLPFRHLAAPAAP